MQTDSKKAKQELEKRMFQVKNIIILELSDKTAETIKGKEGHKQFEEELKGKINEIMQEGKIEKSISLSSSSNKKILINHIPGGEKMSGDVLSQSEIDALLSAISTGEMNADELKKEEIEKE